MHRFASCLLLVALSGCADGWSIEGLAGARTNPFGRKTAGVSTNPTNLSLDINAHPSSNGGARFNDSTHTPATAWQTVVTPASGSFNTGAGPNLFVVGVGCDGSAVPFGAGSGVTCNNCGGITFTDRINEATTGTFLNEFGTQIYTAYSSAGSLSGVTVTWTAHASNQNQNCSVNPLVINGVPASEAASIGASGGFVDTSAGGISHAINAVVNVAASKSWIVVVCSDNNAATVLSADGNTTPWDTHNERTSDSYAFGRYRASGAVQATSGSGNVTLGSTNSDTFSSCAALEIKSS